MANHHLLIVEGSHDAAFFGRLLATRGFQQARKLPDVPDFWKPAIPQQFPMRRDLLEWIMPFPEIYSHPERGDTFGVDVASGDGALLDTLRTALDNNEAATFASLSLVLDTDLQTEAERFAAFRSKIEAWNAHGLKDERPGFPLAFPDRPNAVVAGAPRVGIYLLPGDGEQGTLETILLACAAHRHPDLHARALALITQTDESFPTDAADPLKALRRGSGRAKAHCGVIGNVFKPGASLSVSLRETAWLPEIEADVPSFAAAAKFLDALLQADA